MRRTAVVLKRGALVGVRLGVLTLLFWLWLSSPPITRADVISKEGTLTQDETWPGGNIYIINDHVTINPGVTLVIQPGAIVKFNTNAYMSVYGTLRIQGTADQRVILTSLKDDAVGGDTNGDGIATSPKSGDWASIVFFAAGAPGDDLIEYATIRYGGHYNDTDPGVLILNDASPTIRHSSITSNRHGLVAWGMSFPTVINNAIYRNDFFGFYNGSKASVVTAQYNWWGDASGPNDPSFDCDDPTHLYNPDGRGDSVSDYIIYKPWTALAVGVTSLNINGTVFVSDTQTLPHVATLNGTNITVAVPLACRPQKLTASLGGRNVLLSDSDGDGLWTGVISKTTTTRRTYELTTTATGGTCDPVFSTIATVTLLPASGYVLDADSGAAIAGARVTVYRYDAATNTFTIWNAYANGQINPQITDAQGRFAWDLPDGRYYILAHKAGYVDNRTDPFDVPPPLANMNITLSRRPYLVALPIIVNQQPIQPTAHAAGECNTQAVPAVTPDRW